MHYFVRHTRVNVLEGICYGQTDVDLKSSFESEAEAVKKQLEGLNFGQVYSSPLSRCQRLAEYCGFPNATKSNALMEMNFGDWEMKKWDDVDMSVWRNDWVNNAPPKGESLQIMSKRISLFLSELPTDKDVLIFTHKGVINCAKAFYRGVPLTDIFKENVDYGAIAVF